MGYKVNLGATEEEFSEVGKRLNTVSPDGIWRNLALKNITFEEGDTWKSIDFDFEQLESGRVHKEKFFETKEGASEAKKDMDSRIIEHMFKAFVAPVPHATTGKDVRFGTDTPSVDTYKDLFDFYVDKVDFEAIKPVDLKILYKSNVVAVEEGKPAYPPQVVRGDMPFISSEYSPAVLSVLKDTTKEGPYKRYLTYTVTTLVDAIGSSLPPVKEATELPF